MTNCNWLLLLLANGEIRVSDLERRMHDLASLYPQDVQAMRDELEQHKQILGNAHARVVQCNNCKHTLLAVVAVVVLVLVVFLNYIDNFYVFQQQLPGGCAYNA